MGDEDDFVFVNKDTLDKRSGKVASLFFFEFCFSGNSRVGKGGLVEKCCFLGQTMWPTLATCFQPCVGYEEREVLVVCGRVRHSPALCMPILGTRKPPSRVWCNFRLGLPAHKKRVKKSKVATQNR